jgi:hypothetical protein
MASVVFSGDTSGAITVSAPAIAGTNTLTLPASTGNVVVDTATQTLTNKTLSSPLTMSTSVITTGTTVPTTSGTIVSLATGLPSWVKRITLAFNGVVCAGTSDFLIQIGTGSGPTYTASGYVGGGWRVSASTSNEFASTAGFVIKHAVATYTVSGLMTIIANSSNIYTQSFSGFSTSSLAGLGSGGYNNLGAALTGIQITTLDGLSSFSAGSITVSYE